MQIFVVAHYFSQPYVGISFYPLINPVVKGIL